MGCGLSLTCVCLLVGVGTVFTQDNDTSMLADNPNLNFGGSVSSIAKEASASIKDAFSTSPRQDNPAKELISELQNIPPPEITKSEENDDFNDTKHRNTSNFCQRDYSMPCPLGFNHEYIDKHHCTPSINYTGPCLGQAIIYTTMDVIEKKELSKNCLFNWPCVECERIYSNYCPGSFKHEI